MNNEQLKDFHRRMFVLEIKPTDEHAAAELAKFMATYSRYREAVKIDDKTGAAEAIDKARSQAEIVQRLIEIGRIVEGVIYG